MALTMYAIPNCDTVKKARKWMDANNVEYVFHDYKKQGAPEHVLKAACAAFGWDKVLNMKGMTWRRMDEVERTAIKGEKEALSLMLDKSSIIKRPLIVGDAPVLLGFNEAEYSAELLK